MAHLNGWALIVPIAIFNIVIGLWTWISAERHARYIAQQTAAGDPLFMAHSEHPDFPGRREVSSARAKAAILCGCGVVLLLLQASPLLS